jgi:hypothetical protein
MVSLENFEISKSAELIKLKEPILSKMELDSNNKILINGEELIGTNSFSEYIKTVDADSKYEVKNSAIVKDSNYIHTDNNYTNAEKQKVSSMTSGNIYRGLFDTYASLSSLTNLVIGNWVTVNDDETHSNKKTKYYFNGTQWIFDGIYQESSFGIDDNSVDSTQNGWSASKLINELNSKANKDGTNINLSSLQGDIIPVTNGTQSIGSPTNRFKEIYVNEAKLSVNTLYLGDTPVMGTNQDTIVIKGDKDQSIAVKTTGIGTTNLISEGNVTLSTSGMNANVNVQATGSGANANLSATNQVNLTAPSVNIQGLTNIIGNASVDNLTIRGNVVMNGESFVSNATTVQIEDNIIELNKNEVGYGVTAGRSGLKINRGDEDPYLIVYDETDKNVKIGTDSVLKSIATEDYVNSKTPTNKTVLDKFTEVSGQPYYNGNAIGGGGTGTLTYGANEW